MKALGKALEKKKDMAGKMANRRYVHNKDKFGHSVTDTKTHRTYAERNESEEADFNRLVKKTSEASRFIRKRIS